MSAIIYMGTGEKIILKTRGMYTTHKSQGTVVISHVKPFPVKRCNASPNLPLANWFGHKCDNFTDGTIEMISLKKNENFICKLNTPNATPNSQIMSAVRSTKSSLLGSISKKWSDLFCNIDNVCFLWEKILSSCWPSDDTFQVEKTFVAVLPPPPQIVGTDGSYGFYEKLWII